VVVEFSTRGTARSTGEGFVIASSVAVIQIGAGKVTRYRDYPNTIGIAKVAGVLPQLAASLK
jgi:ketosteroid isomerase-like protein